MAAALILFFQGDISQYLESTGLVARIVLAILLFFSVFSWAIIFQKIRSFKRALVDSHEFLRVFRQSKKLSDIRSSCTLLKDSPLPEVFLSGYREIENQATVSENPGKTVIRSFESVRRSLQIASTAELSRLEQRLSWLATTAATSPFIGLFGTVWGIMDAFHGLGTGGAASLSSVAPGISEALITTAAGLFAAIPALIAYNQFLQRLKEFGSMLDDFALEFLNMTERYFT
ncbi:MAG: MotA/TolQ/ExbB proton channel family protein [Acidobacteria bacterium]|nr:MotA/TolQ/ExbB proton channel family protein [Acidobacteriota bacterium]